MKRKVVLKLSTHDDKTKQKAMKTVSSISGVESVSMDMKDPKLTVIGEGIDAVVIVSKLRKLRVMTEIMSVEAPKEEKKTKDEPDEYNKNQEVPDYMKALEAYHPHTRMTSKAEATCVIC